MGCPRWIAALLIVFSTLLATTMSSSVAQAPSASISLEIGKAGFVIGVTSGSGTLNFNGQTYPLSVGGLRLGLTIGASTARMSGEVYNLKTVGDIEGAYGTAQASAAAGTGGQNLVLENTKGVRLVLRGTQVGLEASLDAGGMVISLK